MQHEPMKIYVLVRICKSRRIFEKFGDGNFSACNPIILGTALFDTFLLSITNSAEFSININIRLARLWLQNYL